MADPPLPTECEVLIVGGSLVGLSAASFLGHHGIRAVVVERHAGTSIHPRAGYFHIGTMEAYRRIGLEPAILEASHEQFGPDGGINLVESLAGRELAQFVPDINAGVEAYSPCKRFFMTQQSLEPLLHRRAAQLGADLHYRAELVDFEQDAGGVSARVRELGSGETRTIRARYMIAAATAARSAGSSASASPAQVGYPTRSRSTSRPIAAHGWKVGRWA